MRYNTDIVVRVSRDVDGGLYSPQAEFKESWQYPHFPSIGIFEIKAPGGHIFFFGVALYSDPEIPRKLAVGGTPVISGMERLSEVALADGGRQGFCVTLSKDDAFKGWGWELMMLPRSPYSDGGKSPVKKFEEWKTTWREILSGVEKELDRADRGWQPFEKRRSRNVEVGGGEDLPAEGVEREGLEPVPLHGADEPGPPGGDGPGPGEHGGEVLRGKDRPRGRQKGPRRKSPGGK